MPGWLCIAIRLSWQRTPASRWLKPDLRPKELSWSMPRKYLRIAILANQQGVIRNRMLALHAGRPGRHGRHGQADGPMTVNPGAFLEQALDIRRWHMAFDQVLPGP